MRARRTLRASRRRRMPHAERCHAAGQLHPRNQNTATGKLTGKMFLSFFERAKDLLGR